MRLDFVTLFPEIIHAVMGCSILGRAQEANLIQVRTADPRDFAYDRHRSVDDRPYGGGPGMLIRVEPVALAVRSLRLPKGAAIVLTDPAGDRFDAKAARTLAKKPAVAFLCGHYEGFDHRVEELLATHVFSVGDFVVTGGEVPALLMADAIARHLPGVLGDSGSLEIDSFAQGGLSGPQYTRPPDFEGMHVPEVLLSGNHAEVERWRREQALIRTRERRPDLAEP